MNAPASVVLVNAAEVARLAPALVNRPPLRELRDIQPGSVVSVSTGRKHHWATVTNVKDGVISGILALEISFGADNVFAIKKTEATHHEN